MDTTKHGTSLSPQPEHGHDLLALENVSSMGNVITVDPPQELHQDTPLDKQAFLYLLVQHLSNSWGIRTAEFAVYLFLITSFPDSLLPASIFGFVTTAAAIVLSGWAGHQVDIRENLGLVRSCIIIIKSAACGMYIPSLMMFYDGHSSPSRFWAPPLGPAIFTIIVIFGCIHKLATISISVAIERDWVTTIAGDSSGHLTTLNTYMRRIDLLCKLLAPLFVSLLTAAVSYKFAAYFLCGVEIICLLFELLWIQIVYRRFPTLQMAQVEKQRTISERLSRDHAPAPSSSLFVLRMRVITSLTSSFVDWLEFIRHPIFLSSTSVAFLYLTVLSFDGTMLSYLKAQSYSDPFLAGIRGINVVAGLMGTLAMPYMERKLGLVRAGNWSIWSEVVCLVPVIVAFYVGAPLPGQRAPAWNATLLFGGMMLSRIGLWAFDLCQLKELQLALSTHPRRNSLTALQFSLQNIADMLKYVLTIILARPSEFKWAALTSFASVVLGAFTYLAYVRRERGHILHHDFGDLLYLITRKPSQQ